MAAEIVFRRAGALDLAEIARLKRAMFEEAGFGRLLADDAEALVVARYRELYADGRAAHFLALAGGEIAALAGAFVKSELPYCFFTNPRHGFLGDVYTAPAWRRRGLARRLSLEALDWLRAAGVDAVRLLASGQGRGLYESLGFAPTDEMWLGLPP